MYLNYRRTLVAGATAAVIIGAGGTSLALTGSDTVNGSPTGSSAQHSKNGKHGDKGGKLLKHLSHAQITTDGKKGPVTHDLIRGTVTAVVPATAGSPASITVRAKDNVSETFVVTKDTKVRVRTKGQKPAESSIAKVAKGDMVFVVGKGATKPTANRIVEMKK